MRESPPGLDPSAEAGQAVEVLEERLRRYPVERYPIQHATAQFHLGLTLTNAGRLPQAAAALEQAVYLFEDKLLPEHARALNALGAVYRLQRRHPAAADIFQRAAAEFRAAGQSSGEGAALHNLGLVQREMGQHTMAADSFRQARALFEDGDVRGRAAASRELGATLLEAGDLEAAVATLETAAELAERAGDQLGVGAATNALGVALLAAGRPKAAVDAFCRSAAANPRSLRPAEYAMAKANLALAWAESGDSARAQLAAGQALAVPQASDVVRLQAADLQRTGDRPGVVLEVLHAEPLEAWPGVLREEFLRWSGLDAVRLGQELAAWVRGQVGDRMEADLAEAWVGALLELPPPQTTTIVRRLLEVVAEQPPDTQEAFHRQLATAMARFHVPQWERLKALFNQIAVELGQEPTW